MKDGIKLMDFLHWGTFPYIKCSGCGKEQKGRVRAVALNAKRICLKCCEKWGFVAN